MQEQWEALQPALRRVDRLEELVARVRGDLGALEVQLEQAEATVEGGPLHQVQTVLRNPLALFRGPGGKEGGTPVSLPPFHPVEIVSVSDFFPSPAPEEVSEGQDFP